MQKYKKLLSELPEEYIDLIVKRVEAANAGDTLKTVTSAAEVIMSFRWATTPEGPAFWDDMYRYACKKTSELPKIGGAAAKPETKPEVKSADEEVTTNLDYDFLGKTLSNDIILAVGLRKVMPKVENGPVTALHTKRTRADGSTIINNLSFGEEATQYLSMFFRNSADAIRARKKNKGIDKGKAARVVYAAIREYVSAMDNTTYASYDDLSAEHKEYLVRMIDHYNEHAALIDEDAHEAWCVKKISAGTKYGSAFEFEKGNSMPVYDPTLVSWPDLSDTQKTTIAVARGVIRAILAGYHY